MCLFWTLPVVVHQKLLPSTRQGSPGLEQQCSPAFPQAGTEEGMELGIAQSRSAAAPAADQVFQSPQADVTSSGFSLQGSWVRPLLKVLKVFARWAGNRKRGALWLPCGCRRQKSWVLAFVHSWMFYICASPPTAPLVWGWLYFATPAPLCACKDDRPQDLETWNPCETVPWELGHPTWLRIVWKDSLGRFRQ